MGLEGLIGGLAGTSGGSNKDAKHAAQRFWGNFDKILYEIENDPLVFRQRFNIKHLQDTSPDFMNMARSGAMRGADVQSSNLINALAARGGGGMQSALTAGAQSRVGAELSGLQAGASMQGERASLIGDMINQYLGGQYGTKASLLQSGASFGGAMVGGSSRVQSAQIGASAQVAGDALKAAGSYYGGR